MAATMSKPRTKKDTKRVRAMAVLLCISSRITKKDRRNRLSFKALHVDFVLDGHRFADARGRAQGVDLVRRLPRELRLRAAEVAVRRGLLEDRAAEAQRLHDPARRHLEVLADEFDELLRIRLPGPERIDVDRHRVGHADRV